MAQIYGAPTGHEGDEEPMSETALQRSIIVALEQMGVWVIRTAVKAKRGKLGARTGEPGMPDLWTEYGWLEIKLPDGVLSHDQKTWHTKAERHGINVETVRSVAQAVSAVQDWRRAKLTQVVPRRRF